MEKKKRRKKLYTFGCYCAYRRTQHSEAVILLQSTDSLKKKNWHLRLLGNVLFLELFVRSGSSIDPVPRAKECRLH